MSLVNKYIKGNVRTNSKVRFGLVLEKYIGYKYDANQGIINCDMYMCCEHKTQKIFHIPCQRVTGVEDYIYMFPEYSQTSKSIVNDEDIF